MLIKSITLYKIMYCILSDIWAINKNEKLAVFLADANPFLCEEGSADPIVYNNFVNLYTEDKSDDYGYDFIANYLANLDNYYGNILQHFKTITFEEYVNKYKSIISLSDEELKNKYK